jgi:hypothetical protein
MLKLWFSMGRRRECENLVFIHISISVGRQNITMTESVTMSRCRHYHALSSNELRAVQSKALTETVYQLSTCGVHDLVDACVARIVTTGSR